MAQTRKPTQEPKSSSKRSSERLRLPNAIETSKADVRIVPRVGDDRSTDQCQAAPKGVVKRKRFRRPKQRKSCRLLALPGELHNRIYQHTLVEEDELEVTATGPGQPGLLRTCKAIRNEASSFYYAENRFALRLVDFDGAAFTPFGRQYECYVPKGRVNVGFSIRGRPNWANLMRWVKDLYLGNSVRPNLQEPSCRDDYVVGAAFKLLDEMKWRGWDKLERVLEAYHHGLKWTCSRCADEVAGHN
ncbi:hypothetical protein LTR85_004268 [Meristemomyces frigidus]|nr:hypothetical protein LTR85_004268 [Meristemomyces frigidus]